METTIPTRETTDSTKPSKLRRAVAVGALGVVLAGCANHDISSAPEPAKPTSATSSTNAQETLPNCSVSTDNGDFTVRAHYPATDSVKAPMITLTSDKQFSLGNFTDYDMAGDWTTAFKHQPESNNVAIRKDAEFKMSFYNDDADLSTHAGHLLLQGHGNAPVSCEAVD